MPSRNFCHIKSAVTKWKHQILEGQENILFSLTFLSSLFSRRLVYLLLSDRGWDAQFREAYLEEALSRQVSWFTKEHKHPELLVLETDQVAAYRLKTTFEVGHCLSKLSPFPLDHSSFCVSSFSFLQQATLSSLRTVMFQVPPLPLPLPQQCSP
jgi:hypothetical protein